MLMATRYEVIYRCPNKGRDVATPLLVNGPAFVDSDPKFGTFQCPLCRDFHTWTQERVMIVAVLR